MVIHLVCTNQTFWDNTQQDCWYHIPVYNQSTKALTIKNTDNFFETVMLHAMNAEDTKHLTPKKGPTIVGIEYGLTD